MVLKEDDWAWWHGFKWAAFVFSHVGWVDDHNIDSRLLILLPVGWTFLAGPKSQNNPLKPWSFTKQPIIWVTSFGGFVWFASRLLNLERWKTLLQCLYRGPPYFICKRQLQRRHGRQPSPTEPATLRKESDNQANPSKSEQRFLQKHTKAAATSSSVTLFDLRAAVNQRVRDGKSFRPDSAQ